MVVVVEVEAVAAAVVRDVVGGEGLCDGAVSFVKAYGNDVQFFCESGDALYNDLLSVNQ